MSGTCPLKWRKAIDWIWLKAKPLVCYTEPQGGPLPHHPGVPNSSPFPTGTWGAGSETKVWGSPGNTELGWSTCGRGRDSGTSREMNFMRHADLPGVGVGVVGSHTTSKLPPHRGSLFGNSGGFLCPSLWPVPPAVTKSSTASGSTAF